MLYISNQYNVVCQLYLNSKQTEIILSIISKSNFLPIDTISLCQNMPSYKVFISFREKLAHLGETSMVLKYKGTFHHVLKFCWRNIGSYE